LPRLEELEFKVVLLLI